MREPILLLPDLGLAPELIQRLRPDAESPLSKTRQFYRALFEAVLDGSLPQGTRLPASRTLAQQLGIARNIVVHVYQQLTDEALLLSDGRRGTRVLHKTALSLIQPRASWTFSARSGQTQQRGHRSRTLAPGEPDSSLFPTLEWKRALQHAARLSPAELGYQERSLPRLQEAIARHLATYRSMPVSPEQVLVTSGTRQSLLLWASLFGDPGDSVLMESPGYLGAVEAFRQQGLIIQACAVDSGGLCPPDLNDDAAGSTPCNSSAARLLYTTPCFQYPTGVPLSTERRALLLDWSRRTGAVIFEDDYDSEFRDSSQPMPALAAQADGARVVHAGTFSKLMFPAARVAWMILPEACMPIASRMLRALGGGHNTVAQATVAELLDNGTVTRHLQRARQVYAHRRAVTMQALSYCQNLSVQGDHHGSLSLVVTLKQPTPVKGLEHALRTRHLGALVLERLQWERRVMPRHCRALVLGLGNAESLSLPETIQRLDEAVGEASAGASTFQG